MQNQKKLRPGETPENSKLTTNKEAGEAAAGAKDFLAKLDSQLAESQRREEEQAQERRRKQAYSGGCGCGY